ncbi:hypothetical protein RHGRI_003066 [Rhododendron griersonianum]|uniref:RRM domain-containing protein n=1 Tax=Rhododendron griersonianum TaxID=479676 RepID=A0AAV6LS16_9ERIC|nr:hypothetical protein RHGRI_003066 [Rhododendron griersonianum]
MADMAMGCEALYKFDFVLLMVDSGPASGPLNGGLAICLKHWNDTAYSFIPVSWGVELNLKKSKLRELRDRLSKQEKSGKLPEEEDEESTDKTETYDEIDDEKSEEESTTRIQYAKRKSDVIAKADGTFVPREGRKRREEKGRKRKDQHDANQAGMGQNPAYGGAYGAAPHLSQIPYMGGAKSAVPEAPAPPLFVQNLPHETTPMLLQVLFRQYPGFKEVRMVEAKPGIAFVEYENEMQSTSAMQGLHGFKISPENPMLITYAKK